MNRVQQNQRSGHLLYSWREATNHYILMIEGEPGKPVGSDLREGKTADVLIRGFIIR